MKNNSLNCIFLTLLHSLTAAKKAGICLKSYPPISFTITIKGVEELNYRIEEKDAGITLANAINFLVEKYELVRIDRRGFSWQEQTPYLTNIDIMRARRDLGLLNRN